MPPPRKAKQGTHVAGEEQEIAVNGRLDREPGAADDQKVTQNLPITAR